MLLRLGLEEIFNLSLLQRFHQFLLWEGLRAGWLWQCLRFTEKAIKVIMLAPVAIAIEIWQRLANNTFTDSPGSGSWRTAMATFSAAAWSCIGVQLSRGSAVCSPSVSLRLGEFRVRSATRLFLKTPRQFPAPGKPRIACQATEKETVQGARNYQLEASELLAELLKAEDVKAVAQARVGSLSEDFFMIASTYLDLAKKEGNAEVVSKLESTLQAALAVKEATLRPEIRLLNQLLRDKDEVARAKTIQSYIQYLASGSYFFQLLGRMIDDVEKQVRNPRQVQLLSQLRTINKETREVTKASKKGKGFGASSSKSSS